MRFEPFLAGLLILAMSTRSHAAEGLDFIVPQSDGYGIAECMKPGEACGQVIADAWCESHGHAAATAFGLADDVTGSVKAEAGRVSPSPEPGSVLIHCGA